MGRKRLKKNAEQRKSPVSAYLIIDGYNLMYAAGLGKWRYGPGELEKCRNGMLNYLSNHLTGRQRARTTIVFDAAEAPADLPRHSKQNCMEIMYASAGSDADSLIEELIAEHSAPRQIRLVSSDHRLQKAARKRRAKFVDSELFVEELEQRGPVTNEPHSPTGSRENRSPKYSGEVSDAETSAWLKEFGEISEAATLEDSLEIKSQKLEEMQADVKRLKKELDEMEE
jgi:predicted RNA-binding protein with PIN domain